MTFHYRIWRGGWPLEPTTLPLSSPVGQRTDDPAAVLFAALYSDLHRLARRELSRRGSGGSLGTTTLLHEAYLQMAARHEAEFPDRARFLAYSARVMRGLVIDYTRSRRALKRGGEFEITPLDFDLPTPSPDVEALERIGEALDQLAALDASLAEVVDLKFFCGFSFAEIAAMRGVSERTVQRRWDRARIYLHRVIGGGVPPR